MDCQFRLPRFVSSAAVSALTHDARWAAMRLLCAFALEGVRTHRHASQDSGCLTVCLASWVVIVVVSWDARSRVRWKPLQLGAAHWVPMDFCLPSNAIPKGNLVQRALYLMRLRNFHPLRTRWQGSFTC